MHIVTCSCGKKVNIESNYCPECGRSIDDDFLKEYLDKQHKKDKQYLVIAVAFIIVALSFILNAIPHAPKINKNSPEYEKFVENLEFVMSQRGDITAYSIGDDSITLATTNDSYFEQEKIACTVQTMVHNSGIVKPDNNIEVVFYCDEVLSHTFH